MNSRERVLAALHRKPADRVPIFMWYHPATARRLASLLEIPVQFLAEVMGDDIRQAWVSNNFAMEGIIHEHEGERHTDRWGITWEKQGAFNQIIQAPLAGCSWQEVLDYRFPNQNLKELFAPMQTVQDSREQFFIGCDISPCVFEMYCRIRSMEQALFDIAAEPEMTARMFQRCADFAIQLGEAACEQFSLDWYWTGDDVASQQALMMHPEMWRAMIKPNMKRIFEVGKTHGLPVAYHCCGALRNIIPDLIEIGMNILNPVQCNCPGMDPPALKKEFGSELTFMGGVDT